MLRELLINKETQLNKDGYLVFDKAELQNMSGGTAEKVINHFHGVALMQIPGEEIEFFKWLKKEDPAVWNDLWANEENPYFVSIDLLKHFISDANGFPICDLIDEPNYWFSSRHLKPKGTEKFSQIEQKIQDNKNLTVDEALLVEVMQASVDIWHFCYKYKFPVNKAKNIVRNMHIDDLIVHLPQREDLTKYLDI
jgi:hypothetical protein